MYQKLEVFESKGFTLDKESNTVAIICQDVTVVLAFDTRERLIQWQVKIANNLGEDDQFLVQIQSAPARGKIPPGPARLHIQEHQFCMTVGVPPRLVGYWQIQQLRRYGVVESRFCFEGGSRCGRGEGLYILVTDQGKEISRAFQLAAEGKLYSRRKQLSRTALNSPRRNADHDGNELETDVNSIHEDSTVPWPSCEPRVDCDYADTASVTDFPDSYQEGGVWTTEGSMERCMSCFSKLGELSRSSTMAQTPGSGFTPAWTSPLGCSQAATSTLNVAILDTNSCETVQPNISHDQWPHSSCSASDKCQSRVPALNLDLDTPLKKTPKPPMPLPPTCPCPYGNYDIPKPIRSSQTTLAHSPTDDLYDTPRQLKDVLTSDKQLSNYDTPQLARSCSCLTRHQAPPRLAAVAREREEWRGAACPCHRIMSWMSLPYCRRGYGRDNTAPPIPRVKLSGEGRMPIANTNSVMPIYATVDRSKKAKFRIAQPLNSKNDFKCVNNNSFDKEPEKNQHDEQGHEMFHSGKHLHSDSPSSQIAHTYINFKFAQSLEFYENSRDVLNRLGLNTIAQANIETHREGHDSSSKISLRKGAKYCAKCGHACKNELTKTNDRHDDYLMMEPSSHVKKIEKCNTGLNDSVEHFPGYLPMQPVSSIGGGSRTDLLEYNFLHRNGMLSGRAASSPSLTAPVIDRSTKPIDIDQRQPQYQCLSANNSPCLQTKQLNGYFNHIKECRTAISSLRRRSNSADSARYIDDLESIAERTTSSTSTIHVINQDSSKCSSMDSLCSQPPRIKKSVEVTLSKDSSLCNRFPITTDTLDSEIKNNEVPYNKLDNSACESNRLSVSDLTEHPGLAAHIRRSASVPCKTHNRDSSSSNDSGVSIGSLKHRGSDFVEFELPLTTSMSTRRHHQNLNAERAGCFHASLPRRSKSSDPLLRLSFKFDDLKIAPKSSSAEAEIPICLIKKESKGFLSPHVPYIDSRSTSSGTSDMSDYIETLSLSSYSSSDTPDSLRFSRSAATTLRPRSGKEYHKIDRHYLDESNKGIPYTVIPPGTGITDSSSTLKSEHRN